MANTVNSASAAFRALARVLLPPAAAAMLAGCQAPSHTGLKAIIGATLIDGTGAAPVRQSVVLISGTRIRAAGSCAMTPVPAGAEKIDARGKFLVPGLIDLAGNTNRARMATGVEDVQQSAAEGARTFFGMVVDTEVTAPELLRQWRRERLVFAPALARFEGSGELLARAMRNTFRLASAGVALAIDSGDASGTRTGRELELFRAAGLRPEQVVAAATSGGALALGRIRDLGTVEAGKRADLVLLSGSPLADPRNLSRPERRMRNGDWVR